MIKKSIAQDFIDRLDDHIDSNVNIIDEDGIIVASRDPSRVGTFHEAAYRLIREREEIESLETDERLPLGSRPGINLPVESEGRTVGVVGVSGEPDRIRDLAYALKTALEMLIEVEYYKDRLFRRRNRKSLFFSSLLAEEPYRPREVERLAASLGYEDGIVRVPVLMPPAAGADGFELIAEARESGFLFGHDLSFVAPDGSLLIFRQLRLQRNAALERYRDELAEFVAELRTLLRRNGLHRPPPVFIGPPQDRFDYYRTAYGQTLWLEERISAAEGDIRFFLDHMQDYFFSRIPREEFMSSFRVFSSLIEAPQRQALFHTVRTLSETNLNIKEAASRLGVHRNTVTARLERIREIFGVDIVNDPQGKDFMFLMITYDQLLGGGGTVHNA